MTTAGFVTFQAITSQRLNPKMGERGATQSPPDPENSTSRLTIQGGGGGVAHTNTARTQRTHRVIKIPRRATQPGVTGRNKFCQKNRAHYYQISENTELKKNTRSQPHSRRGWRNKKTNAPQQTEIHTRPHNQSRNTGQEQNNEDDNKNS